MTTECVEADVSVPHVSVDESAAERARPASGGQSSSGHAFRARTSIQPFLPE